MKYISLLITAVVIFSCQPQAPTPTTPPCDGNCGVIIGPANHHPLPHESGNIFNPVVHCDYVRVENDCGEERDVHICEKYYPNGADVQWSTHPYPAVGDNICNYQ